MIIRLWCQIRVVILNFPFIICCWFYFLYCISKKLIFRTIFVAKNEARDTIIMFQSDNGAVTYQAGTRKNGSNLIWIYIWPFLNFLSSNSQKIFHKIDSILADVIFRFVAKKRSWQKVAPGFRVLLIRSRVL